MYSAFVLSLNIMFEKHLACLFVFSELQDYGSGSGSGCIRTHLHVRVQIQVQFCFQINNDISLKFTDLNNCRVFSKQNLYDFEPWGQV
jgi:hypothetical protein